MKYYHAATPDTMEKILNDGVLKKSPWDGVVYLCKDPIDACKFLVVRGFTCLKVIEVELDENEVMESFDHSEAFFQCKAYMYPGNIELTGSEPVEDYSFNLERRAAE